MLQNKLKNTKTNYAFSRFYLIKYKLKLWEYAYDLLEYNMSSYTFCLNLNKMSF